MGEVWNIGTPPLCYVSVAKWLIKGEIAPSTVSNNGVMLHWTEAQESPLNYVSQANNISAKFKPSILSDMKLSPENVE